MKRYIAVLMVVLLIPVIILFCGCTEQSNNNTKNITQYNTSSTSNSIINTIKNTKILPAKINNLLVAHSGNNTIFMFNFEDNNGKIIFPNVGIVSLEIYDSYGELVYSKNYSLKDINRDKNFYLVTIPSKMLKGFSENGKVCLTYKYNNFKLTTSKEIKLIKYPPEEMKIIFDREYEKNAIFVNKSEIRDNVQIRIIKYGWYKLYDNKTDSIKKVVRVDLEVRNLRDDELVFNPQNIYLTDGTNKYYLIDYGTLPDETKIGINAMKKGYWLFNAPPHLNNLRFFCTIDENYIFDIPLQ